jgi:hypothetical protein
MSLKNFKNKYGYPPMFVSLEPVHGGMSYYSSFPYGYFNRNFLRISTLFRHSWRRWRDPPRDKGITSTSSEGFTV